MESLPYTPGASFPPNLDFFSEWHRIVPVVAVAIIFLIWTMWLLWYQISVEAAGYRRGLIENNIFWGAFWIVSVACLAVTGYTGLAWFTVFIIFLFPILVYGCIHFTAGLQVLYVHPPQLSSSGK